MSETTKNLGLFKYDTTTDGKQVFSIDKGMNDNWDIIDSNTLAHRHITNCITELPQRIKLQLIDGQIILKAGSVVIYPNGVTNNVRQFVHQVIEQDISLGYATSAGKFYLSLYSGTSYYRHSHVDTVFCGTTTPSSSYRVWYDTTNNIIKTSTDGTTWTDTTLSIPFGVEISDGTQSTAISETFNGVGHFGSIVWVDKDVKGLIANGRNSDGTLNNMQVIKTSFNIINARLDNTGIVRLALYTNNFANFMNGWHFYNQPDPPQGFTYMKWFNPEKNFWYSTQDGGATWTTDRFVVACDYYGDTEKITSLFPKYCFKATDYNDLMIKYWE